MRLCFGNQPVATLTYSILRNNVYINISMNETSCRCNAVTPSSYVQSSNILVIAMHTNPCNISWLDFSTSGMFLLVGTNFGPMQWGDGWDGRQRRGWQGGRWPQCMCVYTTKGAARAIFRYRLGNWLSHLCKLCLHNHCLIYSLLHYCKALYFKSSFVRFYELLC